MKTIIISYLFIFFSCSLPSPGEKTFELGLLNSVNILNTKGSCKNTGTRKFTAGKDMNVARYGFTAVNLSNGKILIIGGFTAV
ncbi:MAG TPA: hypothetical protein PL048_22195, partial [Leptospiraceae bacterium]|nr:hypothetical protein [Leptospiraceae bacterium]